MVLTFFSIILINLFLSLDNIIPILFLVDTLKKKSSRTIALFIGLLVGALLRFVLLIFASSVFRFGNVIYIFCGILLIYIGLKGLIGKEMHEKKQNDLSQNLLAVIFSISLIDLSLSLDNVAALIAITRDATILGLAVVTSVLILFCLSFSINVLLQHMKGLDIAAYIAILFLAFKFLTFPFGVNISTTLTSTTIVLICIATVSFMYMKGFRKSVQQKHIA